MGCKLKITIGNIGIVQEASLNLNGFTVIAGENDSGKSTIGKIIYALIQAFTNYPRYRKEILARNVNHTLRAMTVEIRRNFDLTKHDFLRPLTTYAFVNSLVNDVDGSLYEIRGMLDQLEGLYPEKFRTISLIKTMLNSIQREIESSLNDDLLFSSIANVMKSEFGGEVGGRAGLSPSHIGIQDGETTVLDVTFDDGIVIKGISVGDIGFSDATFIDGTAVLQNANAISSYGYENSLPFHSVDLAKKLTTPAFSRGASADAINLSSIYKGRLLFDEERKGFFLDRGGYRVCLSNIASGIKNLGIIDMLIRNGVICEGSLLVLDEPETNLHPKWQIELAKLVCELKNIGVNVVITTHSPYMVQALKHYADKSAINAEFYLACRNLSIEDRVDFLDMSGDVGKIIEALAQPLWSMLEDHDDF